MMDADELAALDAQLAQLSQEKLLSIPTIQNWLIEHALWLRFSALPQDLVNDSNAHDLWINVRRKSPGRFSVMNRRGDRLSRDGRWLYEDIPSERTEEFKNITAFTLEEAVAAAEEQATKVTTLAGDLEENIKRLRAWREELRQKYPDLNLDE